MLKYKNVERSRYNENEVSVLFNEPKLLKSQRAIQTNVRSTRSFSALQRAEIAEILLHAPLFDVLQPCFSALQRAEIAEIVAAGCCHAGSGVVSVLFNEPKLLKLSEPPCAPRPPAVSVLFNEPKLLKSGCDPASEVLQQGFSALQRAEIAEIGEGVGVGEA